jgi:hypothetical protein
MTASRPTPKRDEIELFQNEAKEWNERINPIIQYYFK